MWKKWKNGKKVEKKWKKNGKIFFHFYGKNKNGKMEKKWKKMKK